MMMTRQFAPALCSSMQRSTIKAVTSPISFPFLRAKNTNVLSTRAIKAIAEGNLDVNSFTPPTKEETAATHQWKNIGLYGISPPLLRGRTQFPVSSIDIDTTASLGSPLVLNSASPRNGINVRTHTASKSQNICFFVINPIMNCE